MSVTVLVVEDDPTNATVITDYLDAQGYRVVHARDGDEGLARFRDAAPSLVIVDVLLPRLSGVEVVRELRALPGGDAVPVLLMSAVWRDAHAEPGSAAELAQGFLLKPFRLSDLASRVRELIG